VPGGRAGRGSNPRAGDAGDVRVGGAGERVELQEVPGDDEPEDAADGQRGPQVRVVAAHGAAQVGGPLVEEGAHLGCCFRCGEHRPDEGPGLRRQGREPDVQHVVQVGLDLAGACFP